MIYMFTSEFMNRFDMQQNETTEEDDINDDIKGLLFRMLAVFHSS